MRLSLLKGAHASLSCAARQEILVRSGIRRLCSGFESPHPERSWNEKYLKPRINVS
jgi:hypothetical protein